MADTKITALTAIGLNPVNPATFPIPMVDLLDNSMAASGTTKKVTVNQILGAGGTATLASATITGAATVGTTLGVTGVSTFAAGTALLPALTTTGDTNTGIYYPAADTFAVTTGGTERYRVDSSGNVGIGVTPSAWNSGVKALQIQNTSAWSSGTDLNLTNNAYYGSGGWGYMTTAAAAAYQIAGGGHYWLTAAIGSAGGPINDFSTVRMTLDASGILVVGNTAAASVGVTGGWLASPNSGNSYELIGHNSGSASGSVYSYFFYNSSQIGSITQNGTTGVLYNITSDYRLKESVQPIANGLARVNALKPSIYKWKADGSNGEGFIAHELAEVVPFAVSGEKDAVNEDGSIKPQGIDMSRVVPILVAAIQELTARVQTLETR